VKRNYQYSFGFDFNTPVFHGGDLLKGRRKNRRPIHTKKAMHITLRAEAATGAMSFRLKRNREFIENAIREYAKKWGIRIYRFSINSNHLHLLLRANTRIGFQNFMRVLAAQVATFVTKACKGKPFGKRFWDGLFFSRIVEWGKSYLIARGYVIQNELEAAGVIAQQPRSKSRYDVLGGGSDGRPQVEDRWGSRSGRSPPGRST